MKHRARGAATRDSDITKYAVTEWEETGQEIVWSGNKDIGCVFTSTNQVEDCHLMLPICVTLLEQWSAKVCLVSFLRRRFLSQQVYIVQSSVQRIVLGHTSIDKLLPRLIRTVSSSVMRSV